MKAFRYTVYILFFIITLVVVFLPYVFEHPRTISTDKVIEVETGSPEWWRITNEAEALDRKQMNELPPKSKAYRRSELWVKLYEKEKKLVQERSKYSNNSKEYKKLEEDRLQLIKNHQKELSAIKNEQ